MAKNMSLPAFQYQVVTWWRRYVEGKLPKGNELKHLAQQNLVGANRLIAYFSSSEKNYTKEDIQDELVFMLQNIAIIAHCADISINDIFEAATPGEKKDE